MSNLPTEVSTLLRIIERATADRDAFALENARLKAENERLSARINRMVTSASIEDVTWRPAR